MKKWLIWSVVVIALGTWIIRTFDVPYTKDITQTLQGVQIQLGATDNGSKPVTVQIDGTLHRSIRGKLTYKGTIRIAGEGLSKHDHGLRFGLLQYGDTLSGPRMLYSPFDVIEAGTFIDKTIFSDPQYAGMFADTALSAIVIEVYDGKSGWSNQDGFEIVAPATDRADAIRRALDVTKGYSHRTWGDLGDTWLE